MPATMPTPTPLISAPDLLTLVSRTAEAGQAPDTLIIDCRFNLANTQAGQDAHAQSHIPGALYAHLDRDLSGAKTGSNGRHPLPSPEALARTLSQWGVQPGTQVIAYDDAGGMFAARLWWLLRWLGFDAVRVLDGGWQAWQAVGGPVDTAASVPTPARAPSHFVPAPRADWLRDADAVLADLPPTHQPQADRSPSQWPPAHQPDRQTLIDARAPDRFKGENETMDPVGGHIPGARNRFFQLNLQTPNGCFKAPQVLRAEFAELLGNAPLDTVVHQCGSGVTACHNLLAMAHAGLPPTRLYAGSWSEWCANPARPVAR